jgi:hypothetical protein
MCDHGHSHNHGGCGSEAVTFEYGKHNEQFLIFNFLGSEEQQYNMGAYIDRDKAIILNEETEGTGIEVFKKWDDRMDK